MVGNYVRASSTSSFECARIQDTLVSNTFYTVTFLIMVRFSIYLQGRNPLSVLNTIVVSKRSTRRILEAILEAMVVRVHHLSTILEAMVVRVHHLSVSTVLYLYSQNNKNIIVRFHINVPKLRGKKAKPTAMVTVYETLVTYHWLRHWINFLHTLQGCCQWNLFFGHFCPDNCMKINNFGSSWERRIPAPSPHTTAKNFQ